jgi:hypothetical protein
MMTLEHVLWVKIVLTAVLWAAPLLLCPVRLFRTLGFPPPEPMVFTRLLGAAFLSLLVGYVQGLQALVHGEHPAGTVVVGMVSNGLACVLIIGYGLAGTYARWGRVARVYMWLSALATGLITLGLFVTGWR